MTTATATKTVTFKSAELGTVVLNSYVDPCPGKIGTDKVPSTCGRCGGTGAFGPVVVYNGRCFQCGGAGMVPTNVSTVRKHARTEAFNTEYAAPLAAVREAAAIAANEAAAIAEFNAAWDAAHVEAARRAALVQGFLGEVGEKLTGLVGTVAVAKYISGSYNRSSSMFLVINLDGGAVVKTFGSSESLFQLDRGYRVALTGKVKKHESYNGQDQTVLSHVKAEVIDEAE